MQKISFEIVSDEKKSKFDISVSQKLARIGLIGFIVCFGIQYLLEGHTQILAKDSQLFWFLVFAFLISFIVGIIYGFFESNGQNRVIRGFITFDESEITLNNATKFKLLDLESVNFDVSDIKGSLNTPYLEGDPLWSYGGENYVEFSYNKKNYKYQFVINSHSHWNKLVKNIIPKMKLKAEVNY